MIYLTQEINNTNRGGNKMKNVFEKEKNILKKMVKEFDPSILKNVGWLNLASGIKNIELTKRLCLEIKREGWNN
jgi:nucleosome binding factor SPN SPT16 subunit